MSSPVTNSVGSFEPVLRSWVVSRCAAHELAQWEVHIEGADSCSTQKLNARIRGSHEYFWVSRKILVWGGVWGLRVGGCEIAVFRVVK